MKKKKTYKKSEIEMLTLKINLYLACVNSLTSTCNFITIMMMLKK